MENNNQLNNQPKNELKKKEYWFKRKRFGWGFTPSTWQGWLIILGYIAIIILAAFAFLADTRREIAFFFLIFILASAGFFRIMFAKAPHPKWRWGRKPTDNKDEDF